MCGDHLSDPNRRGQAPRLHHDWRWLARCTPRMGPLFGGMTAPTEDEARDRFCSVYDRWVSLLEDTLQKILDVPNGIASVARMSVGEIRDLREVPPPIRSCNGVPDR